MNFLYYWDRINLKISRFFKIKDPLAEYKIYCYDEQDAKYSLVEILYNVEEKVRQLEEKVQNLEMENIASTKELYRLENSLDARIDIIVDRCRIDFNV